MSLSRTQQVDDSSGNCFVQDMLVLEERTRLSVGVARVPRGFRPEEGVAAPPSKGRTKPCQCLVDQTCPSPPPPPPPPPVFPRSPKAPFARVTKIPCCIGGHCFLLVPCLLPSAWIKREPLEVDWLFCISLFDRQFAKVAESKWHESFYPKKKGRAVCLGCLKVANSTASSEPSPRKIRGGP